MNETNIEDKEQIKPLSAARMDIKSPLENAIDSVKTHNITQNIKFEHQDLNMVYPRTLSSVENQMDSSNKNVSLVNEINPNISCKAADKGREKAYLCPVKDCDEIKLDTDLKNGADIDHLVNCHGWDLAAVGSFELTWQFVALCRFKYDTTT